MNFVNRNSMAIIAGLLCLLVYLPALKCGFVNLDDPDYVLNNPLIRQLDLNLLVSAFTQPHVGWWMPLTWISFAVDHHFWGMNPLGYHLTNLLLHAVNTLLVVLIADRLLRPLKLHAEQGKTQYSLTLLLAALLWGIHPLRVESVAWVTERKDVLNGLFSFVSILCYLIYAERRGCGGRGVSTAYAGSLLFFLLSLMAKSISVVLPLMFLVADWSPLDRLRKEGWRALLLEKLPFFLCSAAMTAVTVHFTSQSLYLVSYDQFPFSERLMVSGTAILEYCRLMLVPTGIIPLFMIPDPVPVSYAMKAAVAMTAICLVAFAERRHAWMTAVLLLFLIPLIPVLAFFQNGDQAFAARFTYLPSLAPSIAAAAFWGMLFRKAGSVKRSLLIASVALLLIVYVAISLRLVTFWDNSGTLWSRVIAYEPGAQAYKERGVFRYQNGDFAGAADDFTASIRLVTSAWRPYVYNLYAHRGESLRAAGRYEESVSDFSEAIRRYPHPSYFRFRGEALNAMGKAAEGEADLRRAGPGNWKIDWYWEPGAE